MKKKILFVLGLTIVLCGNLIVFNSSNDNAGALFNLENIAYADGESGGGGTFYCYSNMLPLDGGRVLECNVPCCYQDDKVKSDNRGGSCTGPFSDCS